MSSIIPRVVRSGTLPPDADAVLFDGRTAHAKSVQLWVNQNAGVLEIRGEGIDQNWPIADIRLIPDQAGQKGLVLGCEAAPLARLLSANRNLMNQFPALHKRRANISRWRLLRWAAGAVASVALIILVLVPLMANQLAGMIPAKGEHALGQATLEQIRTALDETGIAPLPFCENEEGLAALAKMEARLSPQEDPLTVRVLDHDMVNAFALPGGHIVFFRGLIEAAGTPEEVAAVFAHEMGHVVSRDPTRHALRSAGSIGVLGLLFGDFAGGALVLFLTEQLIEARYSQQAETDADAFAYDVLSQAGVPPSALGDMFDTFRTQFGDADGVQAHFLSHPKLSARIADARAATPEGFEAQPILTDVEWSALQNICD
ncbi:MAG: M48 family metallopeptidase [Shimia thalassica]|uniref:M48 family metallopeptidase n=1 Tax=Shimia thalassica TaxID=1715693 RepID=UPI0032996EB5